MSPMHVNQSNQTRQQRTNRTTSMPNGKGIFIVYIILEQKKF